MRHRKSSLLAFIVFTGLATSSASAQQFGVAGFGGNAFGGGNAFVGNGFNGGFANNGFNNGFGYNNGLGYNNYYRGYNNIPQTYNNMGGLMNSIQTHTGGRSGYSWRYGNGPAPGGRRR